MMHMMPMTQASVVAAAAVLGSKAACFHIHGAQRTSSVAPADKEQDLSNCGVLCEELSASLALVLPCRDAVLVPGNNAGVEGGGARTQPTFPLIN